MKYWLYESETKVVLNWVFTMNGSTWGILKIIAGLLVLINFGIIAELMGIASLGFFYYKHKHGGLWYIQNKLRIIDIFHQ